MGDLRTAQRSCADDVEAIVKRVRRWLVLVLIAASGAACDAATDGRCSDQTTDQTDIREPMVIVIGEDYEHRIDMVDGDRLDVRMTPDGGQLERCDHMGGELIADPVRGLWTCEGVDH